MSRWPSLRRMIQWGWWPSEDVRWSLNWKRRAHNITARSVSIQLRGVSRFYCRCVKQQEWSGQWFCASLINHHLIILCLVLICNFCCLLLWNCKTKKHWNHKNGQHTQNRNETELPLDSGAAGSNDDNEYKGQRVLDQPGPSSTSHPFVTCCREGAALSSSLNLT